MIRLVTKNIAGEIVKYVKELSDFDVNYINPDGIIFASTNSNKIGNYQEIGKKAIETRQVIENPSDNRYADVKPGINIPIQFHEDYIGAIGIIGPIEEVRKLVDLSVKIAQIVLREHELELSFIGKRSEAFYVVSQLIKNEPINSQFLKDFLRALNLDITEDFRTIVAKIKTGLNQNELSYQKNSIENLFKSFHGSIFCFINPDEYVMIILDSKLKTIMKNLTDFQIEHFGALKLGIGMKQSLKEQHISYKTAQLVINNTPSDKISMLQILFDKLDLEILIGEVSEEGKKIFIQKTISALTFGEQYILKVYYENDMSLKNTCAILNMHQNTLQYKLNKISEKCGYNPRSFKDGAVLYIATRLANRGDI